MCLHDVLTKSRFIRKAKGSIKYLNKNYYIGYKVVKRTRRNYLRPSHYIVKSHFEIGTIIDDRKREFYPKDQIDFNYIIANGGKYYSRGFHSLCSLEDALKYSHQYFEMYEDIVIVRVYIPIDSVVAYGTQEDCLTYVSEKFIIPSQYPISPRTGKQTTRKV